MYVVIIKKDGFTFVVGTFPKEEGKTAKESAAAWLLRRKWIFECGAWRKGRDEAEIRYIIPPESKELTKALSISY